MITKKSIEKWLLVPAMIGLMSLVALTSKKDMTVSEANKGLSYSDIQPIIEKRCLSCHATQNTDDIFTVAQKGIILETEELVRLHKDKMLPQVENKVMPLANKTQMTDEERAQLIQFLKELDTDQ